MVDDLLFLLLHDYLLLVYKSAPGTSGTKLEAKSLEIGTTDPKRFMFSSMRPTHVFSWPPRQQHRTKGLPSIAFVAASPSYFVVSSLFLIWPEDSSQAPVAEYFCITGILNSQWPDFALMFALGEVQREKRKSLIEGWFHCTPIVPVEVAGLPYARCRSL